MRRGHMVHELRIAKPTIRDDDRREQRYVASAECCHVSIEHALHPAQFVTARSPRAWRVRTAAGFGVAFLVGCGTSCAAPSLVCAVRRSVRERGTADRVLRGQMLSGRCLADT